MACVSRFHHKRNLHVKVIISTVVIIAVFRIGAVEAQQNPPPNNVTTGSGYVPAYTDQSQQGTALPPGATAAAATTGETAARERYRPQGAIRYSLKGAQAGYGSGAGLQEGNRYIIRKWDTLWDIAGKYLNDPFAWPEIWHLNPYISNPHLIYPDNALLIPGYKGYEKIGEGGYRRTLPEGLLSVAQSAGAPGQAREGGAFSEEEPISDALMETMTEGKVFTSYYLLRAPFLWFETDEKGLKYPGNAYVERDEQKAIPQMFDEITLRLFGGRAYSPGDTVDIFTSRGMVDIGNETANCVQRVGRASVTVVHEGKFRARIFDMWDIITPNDRVAPVSYAAGVEIDTIVDPEEKIFASVIKKTETTESPYLYHTLIIDRGGADGVKLGDCFAIYPRGTDGGASRPSMIAAAVYVGKESSTLSIIKLYSTFLAEGYQASLIKRARYKNQGDGGRDG
jgi:hypothetical protein